MGGEDTLHVRFQTAGFEKGTKRVADGVDLVAGNGRLTDLFTVNSLGRVLRATWLLASFFIHHHHAARFEQRYVLERRDEKVEVINLVNLLYKILQIGHELFRIKIVQDVEVQSMFSARQERCTVRSATGFFKFCFG